MSLLILHFSNKAHFTILPSSEEYGKFIAGILELDNSTKNSRRMCYVFRINRD
jgi:hypothetical protein